MNELSKTDIEFLVNQVNFLFDFYDEHTCLNDDTDKNIKADTLGILNELIDKYKGE